MKRLAVIDRAAKTLFVEDVNDEDIEKCGGIEDYVIENYTFEGDFAVSEIVDAEYMTTDEKTPMEIVFEDL